jgi:glucose dehydrogenase
MIRNKFLGILFVATIVLIAVQPAAGQMSVLTYHNNNSRSGLNPFETILTLDNVNSSRFGKVFFITTDGRVDAQPLYVSGLTIEGKIRNVLYIATEHDTVYAADADTGTSLWTRHC